MNLAPAKGFAANVSGIIARTGSFRDAISLKMPNGPMTGRSSTLSGSIKNGNEDLLEKI